MSDIYTVVYNFRHEPLQGHFDFQQVQTEILTFSTHQAAVERIKLDFINLYNTGLDCSSMSLEQLYEKLEPAEKLLCINLENAMKFPANKSYPCGLLHGEWKSTAIFQIHADQTVQIHKSNIVKKDEKLEQKL